MRLCDETITVLNARQDPQSGDVAYIPTVIAGASWFAERASAVDGRGGLEGAGQVRVRIPADANAGGRTWADPAAWDRAADVSGLWTLRGGDVIARGAVNGGELTPEGLREAGLDCMTVLGVTDNRRAPGAPHWRVTGR